MSELSLSVNDLTGSVLNMTDMAGMADMTDIADITEIDKNQHLLEIELESIEELLGPLDTTGQQFSNCPKYKTVQEKEKKRPQKRDNMLTQIRKLRIEVANQKEKNDILRKQLNIKREQNNRLENLYKRLMAKRSSSSSI